jgi:RNA polymerase sigma-70 factor (ECF subfamily)
LRLERSLDAELTKSWNNLEGWLVGKQMSPSQQAVRSEQLLRLAHALAALPANEREAVELHYFAGLSQSEIAAELQSRTVPTSKSSIAGLLRRGLANLRDELGVVPLDALP